MFAETIVGIVDEAESSRSLSSQRVYKIAQHLRDLEHASKKGGKQKSLEKSSTAWHRASSRLETYVDLGLLDKGRGGREELFEYVYYPTPALQRAVDSLVVTSGGPEWLDENLTRFLFDEAPEATVTEDELRSAIRHVVGALNRAATVLPLGALALGIVWFLKETSSKLISVARARASVEELARLRPELARLSRGSAGERAEFVSFTAKGLGA